jgi:hypothetical protein
LAQLLLYLDALGALSLALVQDALAPLAAVGVLAPAMAAGALAPLLLPANLGVLAELDLLYALVALA